MKFENVKTLQQNFSNRSGGGHGIGCHEGFNGGGGDAGCDSGGIEVYGLGGGGDSQEDKEKIYCFMLRKHL